MLILSILLIVISVILLRYCKGRIRKWNEFKNKINEFHGIKEYPILGNIEQVMIKSTQELFERISDITHETRDYGPVRVWLLNLPTIWMSEAEDIERVIGNATNINKGLIYEPLHTWLGEGLLTSSGKKWQQRRKILTPAFHFNHFQKFLNAFNRGSRKLLDVLKQKANQEVNLNTLIGKFSLDSILETTMGTALDTQKEGFTYQEAIRELGQISTYRILKIWLMSDIIFFFSRGYWIQKRVLKYYRNIANIVISERKKHIQSLTEQEISSFSDRKKVVLLDLMLLEQQQNGSIDDAGIREEVDTFIFEGHDTTALSVSFSLLCLANNRSCQERVYEEIRSVFGDSDREATTADLQELKYMEMCMKESLRLFPSVPIINRKVSADVVTKRGAIIPKGCNVFISIFELHRRPEVFPNPDVFDPERFLPENCKDRHPYAYIPFSSGPRNCIGQKYAVMQTKSRLLEILRNFILEPVDTPESLKFVTDLVLRTVDPIRVKFIPRK